MKMMMHLLALFFLQVVNPSEKDLYTRSTFQGLICIVLLLIGSAVASYYAVSLFKWRKLKTKPDILSLFLFSFFGLCGLLGMLFWKPLPEDYRWVGLLAGVSLLLLLAKKFAPKAIPPQLLPPILVPSAIVTLHYLVHEKIEFLIVFFVTLFTLGIIKELKD
ncbi:Hypothetical protein Minf_0893 [Methylacidiphilum infernorum V4]|uniref:Uncharacterized protein n=2 Tax=Candidatus Methylacidiphilum infernorum TaxID=511746 RepID=B3DUE5_METI4|nr:Hypothetical protein Minf_0893 [Methylacidiphilum infernorum V4]